MALAETAQLAVALTLKDSFSRPMKQAQGQLTGFAKATNTVTGGLKTAGANLQRFAVLGVGAVASQVTLGIKSLQELQSVTAQTDAVIKSTGGAAGLTATQVRNLAQEFENLTTIDDKAVQSAQNVLLTFTNIGGKTFPAATQAVLDISTALGTDLDGAAIQVGKALNDPIRGITALRRVGVNFTKDQEKQIKRFVETNQLAKAQALILRELNVEFGGSAAAQANTFEGRLRRLGDAVEELQQSLARALLPVLEEAASELTRFLSDQNNVARVERFGRDIANGFRELISIVRRIDWQGVGQSLEVAGRGAQAVTRAFLGLPDWLKTAVLTGWGLNKLTGGALTSLTGQLVGSITGNLFSRGSTPANPLFVANVTGGMGGGGLPGAAGKAGGLAAGTLIGGAAITAVAAAAVVATQQIVENRETARAKTLADIAARDLRKKSADEMLTGLRGAEAGIARIKALPGGELIFGDTIKELERTRNTFQTGLDRLGGRLETAVTNRKVTPVNVNVNVSTSVTVRDIDRTVTRKRMLTPRTNLNVAL